METQIYCLNDSRYYTVDKGSTLAQLYDRISSPLPYPCIGARANARTVGLGYEIYGPNDVTFLDITSEAGMRIYMRSLCFLLCAAAADVMPDVRLRIEFTMSRNCFVTIARQSNPTEQQADATPSVTTELIDSLLTRMRHLVEQDLPFRRHVEHASDVIALFRSRGAADKADLIETSGKLYATYYEMNGYVDFYYSALVPSTGHLTLFDLKPYDDGFFLVIPRIDKPDELQPLDPQPKMMQTLRETASFNARAGLQNVGTLNKIIASGNFGHLIRVNEAMQEKRLAAIAEDIAQRSSVRMVLIAGPSSSGKTSTAQRLSVQLMTCLKHPVALSLDNWFVNREDTPRDNDGDFDFESLYALDLDLLNADLTALLAGDEIRLPTYNFQTGRREYRGQKLRLQPDTMLVVEGIHALNPELTHLVPDHAKYRIYASALTTISLDDHNWISTHDNRLLRRIIRDYQYRGMSAAQTIGRWPSVHRGELKWIFPYQEQADAIFNTAMIYEISAIKPKVENVLREVPHNVPEADEAQRLLHFLDYFRPIYETEIPSQSLLREFIGGSVFEV